jgi:hypothetical protein
MTNQQFTRDLRVIRTFVIQRMANGCGRISLEFSRARSQPVERGAHKGSPPGRGTRITLVGLSWFVEWRHLLMIVKPAALIPWHRKGVPVVLALEVEGTG